MTPKIRRLTVRRARPTDVPNLARISHDAFPGADLTVAEREAFMSKSTLPWNSRAVVEVDGVHAGQATAIPFRMWMAGAEFPMGGVAGVAVAPESRRAGVARALMTEMLRMMRGRGDVVSLLYPFRHSFYRSYGYGLIGERQLFDVAPAVLPRYGGPESVRALKREEYALAMECYERVMKRSTCWLERNDRMWDALWKHDETRVFAVTRPGGAGRIAGYFLAEYRDRYGRPAMDVMDYAMEDEGAVRAMLDMLHSQRDQASQVRIFAAPDEYFAQRLVEPERPARENILPPMYSLAGTLGYGYMGRVLDLVKALKLRPFHPVEPLEARITLRDPSLQGGIARATLSLGPAGGRVLKTATPLRSRAGGPGSISIEIPVDLFSQCFFGYLPWTVAARDERMKVRGEESLPALDRAFRVALPSMRDFF